MLARTVLLVLATAGTAYAQERAGRTNSELDSSQVISSTVLTPISGPAADLKSRVQGNSTNADIVEDELNRIEEFIRGFQPRIEVSYISCDSGSGSGDAGAVTISEPIYVAPTVPLPDWAATVPMVPDPAPVAAPTPTPATAPEPAAPPPEPVSIPEPPPEPPAIESDRGGDTVTFTDGSTREYDLIFWAIGYQMAFPMLAPEDNLLDWQDGKPVMFLQLGLPKARGLFIAGLGQARTGGGPLFEMGGYLTARMAAFDARNPKGVMEAISETSEIRFGKWAFGFETVAPADTRSLSLQNHLASGRKLSRMLDTIGAPDAKSAKGRSNARPNLELLSKAPLGVVAS